MAEDGRVAPSLLHALEGLLLPLLLEIRRLLCRGEALVGRVRALVPDVEALATAGIRVDVVRLAVGRAANDLVGRQRLQVLRALRRVGRKLAEPGLRQERLRV